MISLFKKYFLYAILIAAVCLWGYVYTLQSSACDAPLEYSLGNFDQRFNISKAEFIEMTMEASEVWENSVNKDLFVYVENEKSKGVAKDFLEKYIDKYFVRQKVTINLIYDERQQMVEERELLSSQLDQTQDTADSLKKEFQALQENHKKVEAEYEVLLVQYRNVKISRDIVEKKRLELNRLVDRINSKINDYNSLVKEANLTVDTINQTAGQEFEEGTYISDGEGERINIYEFRDRKALVRVLAHEFGHALGIEHNDNQNSIMYYLNKSKNIIPTAEDLRDLQMICKGR